MWGSVISEGKLDKCFQKGEGNEEEEDRGSCSYIGRKRRVLMSPWRERCWHKEFSQEKFSSITLNNPGAGDEET